MISHIKESLPCSLAPVHQCAFNTPSALHILGQKTPINPHFTALYLLKKKHAEATRWSKHSAEGPGEPTLNLTSENAAFHQ